MSGLGLPAQGSGVCGVFVRPRVSRFQGLARRGSLSRIPLSRAGRGVAELRGTVPGLATC